MYSIKTNALYLLALLTIIGLGSCSNDFSLNAPAKEIPIVYGLLSRADDTHYIRVERAFLEEATSGLELAQQADQLYFDDIDVAIVRVNNQRAYPLQRIDGVAEGIVRSEGIFATTPNILYKIDAATLQLQEGEQYELLIRNATETIMTTAITSVVSDLRLNRPIPGNNKLPIRILEDDELTVIWAADETASFFDLQMHINYEEWTATTSATPQQKTVVWNLSSNQTAIDGPNKVEVDGIEFYRFLASAIPTDASVLRLLGSIDIVIDAGGQELFQYINVGQANTGITSAQVLPVFTNLSEGLGIFSSRNQFVEKDFFVDSATRDLLRDGDLTRELNFQ